MPSLQITEGDSSSLEVIHKEQQQADSMTGQTADHAAKEADHYSNEESKCTSSPIQVANPLLKSESEFPKRSRKPSTHDGVFSNLSARPEVMVLPKETLDSPPPYDPGNSFEFWGGRSAATANRQLESPDYDEIVVGDVEVGGYPVYILYLIVAVFFEWIGFIIALWLSQSHAARFGAWSGFGITIALQSVRFSDYASGSEYWRNNPDVMSFVSFLIAFAGYVIFLFGLFSYHRMRNEAQERAGFNHGIELSGIV